MKSYTDLEQSKKLAEILPLESADMCWCNNSIKGVSYTDEFSANLRTVKEIKDIFDSAFNEWDKYWELIPCWSLAALIELMGECRMERTPLDQSGAFTHSFVDDYFNIRTYEEYEIVDAAVEMILKLHEQKLI